MAGRIGLKSMASFSKQSAISLRSGLPLSRMLPLVARESRDRRLRHTLKDLQAAISSGNTFSDALDKQSSRFPPIFVEMVKAGERTGHLEKVFSQLADYFDKRLMLRRAIIRASVYPMIQLTMAYAVLCLVLILFTPDREAMAETIAVCTIAVIVGLIVVSLFLSRTSIGRGIWDRVLLAIPFIRSATIKVCMARFTRAFAMQMESAIPVPEAIEKSALVAGNGVLAKNLGRIAEPVRQGETLTEAMSRSRMMTPLVREVIAVAEETGNFSEALERVADIYEEESMLVLESLPKFIGPVVMIVVGILVVYLFYTVWVVHWIQPALDAAGI